VEAGQTSCETRLLVSPWRGLARPAWVVVFAAALGLQLAIAALGQPPTGRPLVGDEGTYLSTANAWSRARPAVLEPLWAPGLPALLALWMVAFGSLSGFFYLQVAAHLLASAALGRLALRASGDPRVALVATGLFACDPQIAVFAQTYWPETIHLAAALLLFEQALVARATLLRSLTVGVLGALALLFKNALTFFVPILFAAFVWRAGRHQRLRLAALAVVAFVAVLSPVLALNRRLHGFVGISDSGAFNLLLGLTDESVRSLDSPAGGLYREYLVGGDGFAERREYLLGRIRDHIEARGALAVLAGQLPRQYHRLFDRESTFSALLPNGTLARRGLGFREPAPSLATALRWLGLAVYALILAAAPAGLERLWRHGGCAAGWVLGWLVCWLALFVFLHVTARYRVLLLPALDVGAASALVGFRDRLGGVAEPVTWSVRIGTAALGAMLLFFAFGGDVLA
jgi:hypothetical protein